MKSAYIRYYIVFLISCLGAAHLSCMEIPNGSSHDPNMSSEYDTLDIIRILSYVITQSDVAFLKQPGAHMNAIRYFMATGTLLTSPCPHNQLEELLTNLRELPKKGASTAAEATWLQAITQNLPECPGLTHVMVPINKCVTGANKNVRHWAFVVFDIHFDQTSNAICTGARYYDTIQFDTPFITSVRTIVQRVFGNRISIRSHRLCTQPDDKACGPLMIETILHMLLDHPLPANTDLEHVRAIRQHHLTILQQAGESPQEIAHLHAPQKRKRESDTEVQPAKKPKKAPEIIIIEDDEDDNPVTIPQERSGVFYALLRFLPWASRII